MRKWLHRALKGASLTSVLFVFQACYGTPPVPGEMAQLNEPETELVEETLSEDTVEEGALSAEGLEQVAE